MASIFKLAGIDLPVPDHTTLSRRNQTLCVDDPARRPTSEPISLIVDSSGLKICGQGEWHTKKHGQKSHRKWKKLHIGVDDDGWIRTSLVTDGHRQDPTAVPELLEQLDAALKRFVADGIYDNATGQSGEGGAAWVHPDRVPILNQLRALGAPLSVPAV